MILAMIPQVAVTLLLVRPDEPRPFWISMLAVQALIVVIGVPIKNRQVRRRVFAKAGYAEDGSILPPPSPR
jgi:hypothetical protein